MPEEIWQYARRILEASQKDSGNISEEFANHLERNLKASLKDSASNLEELDSKPQGIWKHPRLFQEISLKEYVSLVDSRTISEEICKHPRRNLVTSKKNSGSVSKEILKQPIEILGAT